ncbi:hypothetical protein B0H19DRAFT_938973, partial [Mycena capillaripes]
VFIPVFPASCPYAIAVDATRGFSPEVATNLTRDGFPAQFSRLWYQAQAVDNLLNTIPPDLAGKFHMSGRGYSDVAAQGGRGG